MKSGIYCIHNTKENKRYIGLSKDINARVKNHFAKLRRGIHKNEKLQNDFNKWKDYYSFYIVETVENSSDLNKVMAKREKFWISYWDTVNSGLNQTCGGEIGSTPAGKFNWKNMESGEELIQKTCSEIAELTGLKPRSFNPVCRGVHLWNFGWALKERYEEALKRWSRTKGRRVSVKNETTGDMLRNIAPIDLVKYLNTRRSDVYSLVNGKSYCLYGYRLINENEEFIFPITKVKSIYTVTATNQKSGCCYQNINLCDFSEKSGISMNTLTYCVLNDKRSCKGWEIVVVEKQQKKHWRDAQKPRVSSVG